MYENTVASINIDFIQLLTVASTPDISLLHALSAFIPY